MPESPRELLLRLGALMQSIASRREAGCDPDAADAILWISAPEGACTFVSRGWSEYTGQAQAQAVGQGWISAAHPADRERATQVIRQAMSKRDPFAVDYRLRRKDGAYRWVLDSGRPRYAPGGEFLGYMGSVLDVHELSLAEEARRESERRLRLLVELNAATQSLTDPDEIKAMTTRLLAEHLGADACAYVEAEACIVVERKAPRPSTAGEAELVQLVANRCRESIERARAVCELQEADRRKNEFLATLSHELRNPLAPWRTSLQLLRLADKRDSAAAPVHEVMERQVDHLVRLVDDLLEMSRITHGALELRREPVDLAEIVRNAVETTGPLIDLAAHRLEVSLPAEALQVHGDPVRLTQILVNLLNNAARYTAPGGQIRVAVRLDGDAARISVRDSGAGIPPEIMPRLFAMFARSEGSTGLGIGLALARRLAEMHGGTIEARSDGPGKGSEFTVRLPVSAAAPPVSPRAAERQKLSPRRILLVDDNRDAAESLGMLLTFLGADVEIAHDGPGALDAFARRRPAAVLLDIGMPGMDGYEVVRRLRGNGAANGVRLVALTGWGQEDDRRRVRRAGFDQHLIKPADLGALRALLVSLDGPEA